MQRAKAFFGEGRTAWFGWCLALLWVALFLAGMAAGDGVHVAPLHQPVLVDGEVVDPTDGTTGPILCDAHVSGRPVLPDNQNRQKAGAGFCSFRPPREAPVVFLTSRPPPSSRSVTFIS